MITVEVRRGRPFRLEVRGHAGQAPHGQDLVCAAASALAETLALGLEAHHADGRWRVEEGLFSYEGEPDATVEAILETFVLGFQSLAESHGRYVRFKEVS
jgi:uncharacterized protein YsxB (DUF464 family)